VTLNDEALINVTINIVNSKLRPPRHDPNNTFVWYYYPPWNVYMHARWEHGYGSILLPFARIVFTFALSLSLAGNAERKFGLCRYRERQRTLG
jgi:hypothetical protein